MRCPKCQYISFDGGERCRNCGFDFSLSVEVPAIDLPMQDEGQEDGPLSDFPLTDPGAALPADGPRPAAVPAPVSVPEQNPITGSFDLPLFKDRPRDDEPLVTPGAAPRAPLAVRRATAPTPRPRARKDATPEEPRLALETAEMPVVPQPVRTRPSTADRGAPDGEARSAPIGARVAAGLVDLTILVGIDAGILYFTLRICELRFAEAASLPLVPFIAFIALLNGGYFAAFVAASGQTIGKMAAGIRVIPGDPVASPRERVTAGHAIVRAAAYLVSALPAGLGFVPAFVGQDRRALHDRLADTRVVKA